MLCFVFLWEMLWRIALLVWKNLLKLWTSVWQCGKIMEVFWEVNEC